MDSKGYLARMAKTLARSVLLVAYYVTYRLLRSMATLPPIYFTIKSNMNLLSSGFFKAIKILTRLLRLLIKSTVIVPSPSNNPTKNCSM